MFATPGRATRGTLRHALPKGVVAAASYWTALPLPALADKGVEAVPADRTTA